MGEKLVLLYSGGLDTSVIMKWLSEKGYEVYAYVADVGQREDWSGLEEKALNTGASGFRIGDLKEEFVRDFVFPAMRYGALYEGRYMLGTSLARPIIVKGMIDYCKEVGATAFAHGATGKGNDQVRFELTAAALMPDLKVIAPWRMQEFRDRFPGRKEMIEYAEANGIPVKATQKKPWSSDENLLHISFEAGVLEDPDYEPDAEMFELTCSPEEAPDKPEYVEIIFDKGVPVRVNGDDLGAEALLMRLNEIAGRNGVGRIDIVESRFVGMKSRGVYETPGGTLLWEAFRDIEAISVDRGVLDLKNSLMPRFAKLVYNGFWYSDEADLLRKLADESSQRVSGHCRLKLYKGSLIPVGRGSSNSLYDDDVASMDADSGAYNQDDATGFIRLNGLPLRVSARSKNL